jgi:hypothetical protein
LSEFETVLHGIKKASDGKTLLKEVKVNVATSSDNKQLIVPQDKLISKTRVSNSKVKAVNVLRDVSTSATIVSTCESIRSIVGLGKVEKELMLKDGTKIFLVSDDGTPKGLAMALSTSPTFDYYSIANDYNGLVAASYNRLYNFEPENCSSCKRELIDLRGMGRTIK